MPFFRKIRSSMQFPRAKGAKGGLARKSRSIVHPFRTFSNASAAWTRTRSLAVEFLDDRTLLAGSPGLIGTPFFADPVNFTQANADMAMDAAGNYVVTWESTNQDASGKGIYARRFNASGVPQGSAFPVNSQTTSNQHSPQVAMDADGDFVIVWAGSGLTDPDGIWGQLYSAAGVPVGGQFRVNTPTAFARSEPAVAMDQDGDFVVAWRRLPQSGVDDGIYARRYDAAGVAQGTEFQVNTLTTGDQYSPHVLMDSGGNFVIAFSSSGELRARFFDSSGVASAPEVEILEGGTAFDLAMQPSGAFVAAYYAGVGPNGGYTIAARRFSASGVALGNDIVITRHAFGKPSLTLQPDGSFYVAYTDRADNTNEEPYETRVQRVDTNDMAGSSLVVHPASLDNHISWAVAASPAGDIIVAWESHQSSWKNITVRHLSAIDPSTEVLSIGTDTDSVLAEGEVLAGEHSTFTIVLTDQLATTGLGSATSIANWTLLQGTTDITSHISSITQQFNAKGEWEVVITLPRILAEGTYALIAHDTILDALGRALDGDSDGAPGGDFVRTFDVLPPYPTPVITLPTGAVGSQRPMVASEDDGSFVVGWAASGAAFLQRYDRAGTLIGPTVQVASGAVMLHPEHRISMISSAGQVAMVFADGVAASNTDIYLQRVDLESGLLNGTRILVNQNTSGIQSIPVIGADALGNFVVVWKGGLGGLAARRFDASGTPMGDEFAVSDVAVVAQDVGVAMTPSGQFTIAWKESSGAYFRSFDAAGSPLGPRVLVSTASGTNGQVAVDRDGNVLVVKSGSNVEARRFDATGVPLEPWWVVASASPALIEPRIAMNGDGEFVITYGQSWSQVIQGRRFAADGTPIGGQFIVGTDRNQDVSIDANGDFVIVWSKDQAAFAQRFTIEPDFFPGNYVIEEGQSLLLDVGGPYDPAWTYSWDINGDGVFGDATGIAPTLTWPQLQSLGIVDEEGIGTLAVRVSGMPSGPIVSDSGRLIVENDAPTIALTGDPQVPEGSVYELTLGPITEPGADTVTQWIVHWGDGQIDTYTSGGTVTHTYGDDGSRLISVDLVDEDGTHGNAATLPVTVLGVAPTTLVLGPTVAFVNEPRTFTLQAVDPSLVDQAAHFTFTIDWNGDGTTDQTVVGPSGSTVSRTFTSVATVTIRVRATDVDGLVGSEAVHSVNVQPAIASAGGPYATQEGQSLILTGSAEFDTGDGNTTYSWDVNGDGVFGDAVGQTATLTWNDLLALGIDDGPYAGEVVLSAVNGLTNESALAASPWALADTAVAVGIIGPAALPLFSDFVATLIPSDYSPGDLTGNFTFAVDWDADGSFTEVHWGTTATITRRPTTLGTYQVAVKAAKGASGDFGPVTVFEYIVVPAPDSAGGPYTVPEHEHLSLTATSSVDTGDGNTIYAWDIDGDGVFDDATGRTPTVFVDELDGPGTYPIGVRAHNTSTGLQSENFTTVDVSNATPNVGIDAHWGTDPWVRPNQLIHFHFTADDSTPDEQAGIHWTIDWTGDGVVDEDFLGSPSVHRIWSYSTSGNYSVRVTATDKEGATGDRSIGLVVTQPQEDGFFGEGEDLHLSTPEWNATWTLGALQEEGRNVTFTAAELASIGLDDDQVLSVRLDVEHTYWIYIRTPFPGHYVYYTVYDTSHQNVTMHNTSPTASIAGDVDVPRGHPQEWTLTAVDPSPTDQAAGFTFEIDWDGDGTTDETVVGPSGMTVTHNYEEAGSYDIRVIATDKDGGVSPVFTLPITVIAHEVVGGQMFWYGSNGDDTVAFAETAPGSVQVTETKLNGVSVSNQYVATGVTSMLLIGARGGNDIIDASPIATLPLVLSGADGNDSIRGGSAGDLLLGDAGLDTLWGGLGNDNLQGGDDADLIFGDHPEASGGSLSKTTLGEDTITAGAGNDTVYGDGDGGEGTADTINGDAGDDTIFADGSEGATDVAGDFIDGGADDDTITSDGGEGSSDTVLGSSGDDYIDTGMGSDSVDAGTGNDIVLGGDGSGGASDTLLGGDGRDILVGDGGLAYTGAKTGGIDSLDGGVGSDIVIAGYVNTASIPSFDWLLVRQEWVGASSLADRRDHLTGMSAGLNGSSLLTPGGTITDDEPASSAPLVDIVLGGSEEDWILADASAETPGNLEAGDILDDLAAFPL